MRTSTGAIFYYTLDGLGSTILLTDSAQATAASYAYDSWGNTTATGAQAAANPWQYAGGYKDTATGYTKFGARYYDPTVGRFTQPDPSGQEANRYAYAQCNPINATDATGLCTLGQTIAIAGGIGGIGAIVGAGIGALLGVLGGPFAEITVPGGALLGGIIGGLVGLDVGLALTLFGNCE